MKCFFFLLFLSGHLGAITTQKELTGVWVSSCVGTALNDRMEFAIETYEFTEGKYTFTRESYENDQCTEKKISHKSEVGVLALTGKEVTLPGKAGLVVSELDLSPAQKKSELGSVWIDPAHKILKISRGSFGHYRNTHLGITEYAKRK